MAGGCVAVKKNATYSLIKPHKSIITPSLYRLMTHKKYGEMSELAEGARLEIVCAVNSGTEGSNPSLSAITHLPTNRHNFSGVSAFFPRVSHPCLIWFLQENTAPKHLMRSCLKAMSPGR